MKKFAFLALVVLAAFAAASCGEDTEIDYSDSYVRFTLDGTSYTFGGDANSFASISGSGNELTLFAQNIENANDTFNLKIDLTGKNAPYSGDYATKSFSIRTGGITYSGFITLTLDAVPDAAGEIITGSFSGSAALTTSSPSGSNKTLTSVTIHLVLKTLADD